MQINLEQSAWVTLFEALEWAAYGIPPLSPQERGHLMEAYKFQIDIKQEATAKFELITSLRQGDITATGCQCNTYYVLKLAKLVMDSESDIEERCEIMACKWEGQDTNWPESQILTYYPEESYCHIYINTKELLKTFPVGRESIMATELSCFQNQLSYILSTR